MESMPSNYWAKWIKANDHEKVELIKDLKITKFFASLFYPKLDSEQALNATAIMLNSYFEDLAEHMLVN
jgi:hypothetical protein